MKKRQLLLLVILVILFPSCRKETVVSEVAKSRYNATFLTLFDTVTTILGYSENEETFEAEAQRIHDELSEYHQLYDIYNDYEGVSNIKTINDNAGISPVVVDERIIDMLLFAKEMYSATDGKVNVAMGSVLSLWHEAREDGYDDPESAYLPSDALLRKAAEHIDIDAVVIDQEASTVYISDPSLSLDVGAIAKGYAVEKVGDSMPEGFIISVGGNVYSTGAKPDGTSWVIGLQEPGESSGVHSHTLYLDEGAVTTSGDYQRYYVVDGKEYNHIIDPDTLYPATRWKAVSVMAPSSAVADALSTALFILDQNSGQALLDEYSALAMWTTGEGEEIFSPGFSEILRT